MENETVVHFEGNLRFEHTDHMISGVGNGPIDAFFNALKTVGITDYKLGGKNDDPSRKRRKAQCLSHSGDAAP